jgi:hypothetical protein
MRRKKVPTFLFSFVFVARALFAEDSIPADTRAAIDKIVGEATAYFQSSEPESAIDPRWKTPAMRIAARSVLNAAKPISIPCQKRRRKDWRHGRS